MALPLVLGGPIVRRVEARLACVWVATREACQVRVRVWPGAVSAGSGSGGGLFDVGGQAAEGTLTTLRVGQQLHVAAVVASTVGNQPFLPATRYSYNVTFTPVSGAPVQDLHSLGLLADRPEQPALGYQAGLLPSFPTCPDTIDDLILLHGSCNRIDAAGGPNLMFAIDELILHARDDPRHRPHQLWLSGDQVYADEVPAVLSVGLTATGRDLMGAVELMELKVGDEKLGIPLLQANFPAGYRQQLMYDEAKLTSSESASHLLGMTERLTMQLHLWSPEVWDRQPDGSVFLAAPGNVLPTPVPLLLDALEDAPNLTPTQIGAASIFLKAHLKSFSPDEYTKAVREATDESKLVLAYAAQVGRIRRALANVPTYFVFDDHDVTDDWNLCQLWKDRVEGNGLGRSVLRDGLATFAVMQGWGNDPVAYQSGTGAQLLDAIQRMFPVGATTGPDPTATTDVDRLLGLDGQPPVMRWNYTVDGAVHRVLACDTRTRRGFTSPVSPPIQLTDAELGVQIPAGPLPAGFEVLIVVLSQPALDPVMLGEVTQGLIARGMSAFGSIKNKMDLPPSQAHALTGLESLDYEGWAARPAEIPRLLDRLATYDRVMILSGDVHFACSLGLRLWRQGQGLVSTIGQFTSSAVQYITFPEVLVPLLGQGWANELLGRGYPFDLLVWRDPAADPVEAPSLPARALRRRLLHRPVILPTQGWPAGTQVTIPPDMAMRLELLSDARPDAQRPEPVRPEPLQAEFDGADALHGANGYGALARRHANNVKKHNNTRSVAIYNKITRLTFRHTADNRLVTRSELMSIDHHQPSAAPPEPFTLHELVYDALTTAPEPTIPA